MNNNNKEFSNILPISRFIIIYFATFWLYQFIWIYKTWKFISIYNWKRYSKITRTLFSWIFIFSLWFKLKKIFKENNIKNSIYPIILWILYNLFHILFLFQYNIMLLWYLWFIIFIPYIEWINNYYYQKENTEKIKKFSLMKIIFITLWIILFIYSIIIILFNT